MGSMGLRTKLVLGLVLALGVSPAAAGAAVQLVTVPVHGDVANSDPDARPHLAYNGHTTTLRAIARGLAGLPAADVTFAWDTDADGSFSDETEELLRQCVEATPEGVNCYDLGKQITIPNQATSRRFDFQIRLTIPGQAPIFATYPVWVRADVPADPVNASDDQLAAMRSVAVDDALWYLHLQMGTRTGTGSGIRGALNGTSTFADKNAAFVRMAARAGHRPAYPVGTYRHDIWPFVPGRPPEPPAGFVAASDSRYANDPYAEDAMRALNTALATRVTVFPGIPAADEEDDGTTPVPATNDGFGLGFGTVSSEMLSQGDLMEAIAASGLAGTVTQVGETTRVLGRTFEHVEQQLVDFLVFAQMDVGTTLCIGGWNYQQNGGCGFHLNHENSSRSVYGGLLAAKSMAPAGVYVNNRVRSRMASILKYTQHAGSKFSQALGCTTGGVFQETGDVLLAIELLGWDGFAPGDATPYVLDAGGVTMTFGQARQIYDDYFNALGTNWVSFQADPCWNWISGLFFNDGGTNPTPYLRQDRRGNIVGLRALSGGLRSLDVDVINGHDWRREFAVFLVRNQYVDGHWLDEQWGIGFLEGPGAHGPVNTVYGVETLTEPLAPAPDTQILSGPSGPTADSTPTFVFSSDAGATFECHVDAGAFAACDTPHTTAVLGQGAHTLTVRALSPNGVLDPTPATRSFTVDTTAPPLPAINTGPSGTVASTSASFMFSDSEGSVTFECKLDGGAFAPCTSPRVLSSLAQGAHSFQVRAQDAIGNTSGATTRAWSVDTVAPQTTVKGPKATTPSRTAKFTLRSSEPNSTFRCKLDKAAWKTCKSPVTYKNLKPGKHTLQVKATDALGNADLTPAKFTWRIT